MLTGYFQKTWKGFEKGLVKSIKVFLKKKNNLQYARECHRNLSEEKNVSMVVNAMKIFLKMKNKG